MPSQSWHSLTLDGVRRGFTTLSAVLGKLAMCTHEALLQALSSEANPAALTALLRFAAVLFGVTPYQRLPPTLLPGVLQVCALSHAASHTRTPTIDGSQLDALPATWAPGTSQTVPCKDKHCSI